MQVSPIDYGRYGSEKIRRIFSYEGRLERMLLVEAAVAKVQAKYGIIPPSAAVVISEKANLNSVSPKRVKELEKELKHETVAVVEALAEACGEAGEWVHYGLTSNDVLDTALGLMLKDALGIIENKMKDLLKAFVDLAGRYKGTVMVGRTHGQHALPITFGFKVACWIHEMCRNLDRLEELKKRVLVGKIRGAVGTGEELGEDALRIEREVLKELGLKPAEGSTQIVPRDVYAELLCFAALLASSLAKYAEEVRNLQRPEILEVAEPFEIKRQVGSSVMPHKQNPVYCESICGLAKVLRSYVVAALENIMLWHERDLTNSSCERMVIPESVILLEEMLTRSVKVFSNLVVFPENMKKNLEVTEGRNMAAIVALKLGRKIGRRKAYWHVRNLALKSARERKKFKEVLLEDDIVKRYLGPNDIEEALNPEKHIGKSIELVEEAVKKAKRYLRFSA